MTTHSYHAKFILHLTWLIYIDVLGVHDYFKCFWKCWKPVEFLHSNFAVNITIISHYCQKVGLLTYTVSMSVQWLIVVPGKHFKREEMKFISQPSTIYILDWKPFKQTIHAHVWCVCVSVCVDTHTDTYPNHVQCDRLLVIRFTGSMHAWKTRCQLLQTSRAFSSSRM